MTSPCGGSAQTAVVNSKVLSQMRSGVRVSELETHTRRIESPGNKAGCSTWPHPQREPVTLFSTVLLRRRCTDPRISDALAAHQRAELEPLCRPTLHAVQHCKMRFHQSGVTTTLPLSRCRSNHFRRASNVLKVRKKTHRRAWFTFRSSANL